MSVDDLVDVDPADVPAITASLEQLELVNQCIDQTLTGIRLSSGAIGSHDQGVLLERMEYAIFLELLVLSLVS